MNGGRRVDVIVGFEWEYVVGVIVSLASVWGICSETHLLRKST